MPASRSREGQGEGMVGGGPEPASRQATVQPGAETPVYNDFFFFKPPLMLYKPTVQAHSPQRASQRHSLGVWEKQQIPLAPPTPQTPTTPPLHLTSLEKGSEGAGHLLVSENLETALS